STIKTVGLCNVPIGIIMAIVEATGCALDDVQLDYVGLNHLGWIRRVFIAGKDVTGLALEKYIEHAPEEWEVEAVCKQMIATMRSLKLMLNIYLQYYYATDTIHDYLKNKKMTRGEEVVELEKTLFEKYRQPELHEKPEELSERGGAHYSTAAFHLIGAMHNDTRNTQIVCCRNGGAVPTFDDDVAVEVPAIIGKDGATAIPQPAPDPLIRGLMQAVKAYETMTVEAAVSGDRERAFEAMLMHPLMPGAMESRALLDELLEINKPHLQGTFF
ncbi:MAG: 6-phospho-beta-glucosidase, partial [Candidatus Hydrogenedentes bacterium]|nr:6-phospho-beta-glucosidase [Candidatus Hydrogenedentota bacterium]